MRRVMKPSLALRIGAVAAFVPGLAGVLAPEPVLSSFELGTPVEALIQTRDLGVALMAIGVINWSARDAVGAPLRGLLWGNILFQVANIVVHVWEIVAGLFPAWAPAVLVLPLALLTIYLLALRRA
jgi:hypothetical protein